MSSLIAAKTTFKHLNIHQLYIPKDFIDEKKNVELFIKKIVDTFNANKTTEDPKEHQYKELTFKDWDVDEHHGFSARLYFCKRIIQTKFANWVNLVVDAPHELQSVNLDFLFFLYRNPTQKVSTQWELFALTTNTAWQVIKAYTNFRFPIKIALRIVQPDLSSAEKKPLTGDTDSSVETYRSGYALLQNEMDTIWRWFKSFKSYFKTSCSLYNGRYKVSAFSNRTDKVSVSIGSGRMTINGAMTLAQHEELLVHLSRIARKEETYAVIREKNKKVEVLEEDDPAIQSLENIQPVESSLTPTLNQAIIELVWTAFQKTRPMAGIFFVHRFYKDFYNSDEFFLSFGKKPMIMWNHHPSFLDIITHLRLVYGVVKDLATFTIFLNDTKFRFSRKKQAFPLVEFFQGELKHKGEVYFRVDGLWLEVKADQLIVTQRHFHEILKTSLLQPTDAGALTKPWTAKTEWASFTLESAQKKLKDKPHKTLQETVKALKEEEYSFLSKKGKVLMPYVTNCLFEEGSSYCKLLKKRRDQLQALLQQKYDDDEEVTLEDLKDLLRQSKSKQTQLTKNATQLLKSLTLRRPVLKTLSRGKLKKVRVLDANKVPIITDIFQVELKYASTALIHAKEINEILVQKAKKQEPLKAEDFKPLLTQNIANSFFEKLQTPQNVKGDAAIFGEEFIVEGRVPKDISKETEVVAFFQEQHRLYRSVVEEEGYNRFYLEEDRYLVCDQVYGSKKEQVELFDILRFAEGDDHLLLYHVKESFQQKTRDACAQIRAAANVLKGKEALKQLYDNIVKKVENPSPFRKKLKEKFGKYFKDKSGKPSREAFLKLFDRPICFVYAFIDDGQEERFLLEEKSPSHVFTEEELAPFVKKKQSVEELRKSLSSYLDKNNRLTATLLRTTKEQFCASLDKHPKASELYDFLCSKVSMFDSLVAKIEIIELHRYLRGLGYDFKICQIGRTPDSQPNSSFGWQKVDLDKTVSPPSANDCFAYKDKKYTPQTRSRNHEQLLAYLCGIQSFSVESQQLRLRFFKLLSDHAKHNAVNDYLAKKSVKLDYTHFLDSKFKFTQSAWELAASLNDYRLVVFSYKQGKEVDVEKPEIINPTGKRTLYLLQDKENYFICDQLKANKDDKTSDDEETPTPSTGSEEPLSLTQTLSQTQQEELLSQQSTAGLPNSGNNDCFFNSITQVILNSPLLASHLLDKDNLVKPDPKIHPHNFAQNQEKFFTFWRELSLNYHLTFSLSQKVTSYETKTMRTLLGFEVETQEDAQQALDAIFRFYTGEDCLYETKVTDKLDLTKKKELTAPKECGEASSKGMMERSETGILIPLDLDDDSNLQDMIKKALHHRESSKETRYFSLSGKKYSVPEFTTETEFVSLKNEVFFSVRRFKLNKKKTGYEKNSTKINFDKETSFKLLGRGYRLQAFVTHEGSRDAGHYIAYCRTGTQGWQKFNDEKVTKITEKEALEAAEDSYIIHLVKKQKKRHPPRKSSSDSDRKSDSDSKSDNDG